MWHLGKAIFIVCLTKIHVAKINRVDLAPRDREEDQFRRPINRVQINRILFIIITFCFMCATRETFEESKFRTYI